MKKGFTLIELLAVIVILAIIALIATPIVLNIINDSRKESIRLSAENYLDAVEQAIAKDQLNNNMLLDGEYKILDNGKHIQIGENEPIEIQFDGTPIKNGSLIIKNGNIEQIKAGQIDRWYPKIVEDKVKLFDELAESTLVKGQEFNKIIKNLANNSTDMTYSYSDNVITSIEFLSYGRIPEGYTNEDFYARRDNKETRAIVSEADSITPIYAVMDKIINEDGTQDTKIFIYSEGEIHFNKVSSYLFYELKNLKNIKFGFIYTSKAEYMHSMFSGCSSLTSLDLSMFDTSEVIYMEYMFDGCSSLTSLDLSMFDTSKVTNMSYMFDGCSKLTSIDVSNFDTSKVTNMSGMFDGCSGLTSLDLSSFDTSNVSSMYFMFKSCSSLTSLNLSNFDASRAETKDGMFYGCSKLIEILVSNKWSTIGYSHRTFYNCATKQVTYI